jgi:hypothetical protein
MEFGFYPKHFRCQIGGITISTLDDLDGKVRGVMQDGGIDKDWCYAPPARNRAGGRADVLPFASRLFGLPKTHALNHASPQSDDQLRFLIQCFGFFVGMRMTDTEAGFLDATPVKPGKTSDMVWLGDSHINALAHADQFWFAHTEHPRICAAMRGIIHNYFLSATPTLLDFERFIYLYVVLEVYLAECSKIPIHRLGSTLCLRPSAYKSWIESQENRAVMNAKHDA